jgi:hypothetical protein
MIPLATRTVAIWSERVTLQAVRLSDHGLLEPTR